jgi:hypothetical protein
MRKARQASFLAPGQSEESGPPQTLCFYSPECVEGVFSEIHIHDPA